MKFQISNAQKLKIYIWRFTRN